MTPAAGTPAAGVLVLAEADDGAGEASASQASASALFLCTIFSAMRADLPVRPRR